MTKVRKRIGHLRDLTSLSSLAYLLLGIHLLSLAVTAWFFHQMEINANWLNVFLIPNILAALLFPRSVYLALQALLTVTIIGSLWAVGAYDAFPEAIIMSASGFILAEGVHRINVYRQRYQREHLEHERIFRGVVEQATDGIFLVDKEGYLTVWNRELERITGIAASEVLNTCIWEADFARQFAAHASEKALQTIRTQIEAYQRRMGSQPPALRSERRSGDGDAAPETQTSIEINSVATSQEPRSWQIILFPLYLSQGTLVGGIVKDITKEQRVQAEQQMHTRFLELLSDITIAALGAPDLQKMLQMLADRLAELLKADGCYVTLWDAEKQRNLPAAAAFEEWRDVYPTLEPDPDEVTLTASVLKAERPLVIENVHASSLVSNKIARMFPERSIMAFPLIADGQKFGAVLIAHRERHQFTEEEVQRGEQAVRQISLALAKTRLLEAEREQRLRAETLAEVTLALNSRTRHEEVMQEILKQAQRIVPFETANVALREDDHFKVTYWQGYEQWECAEFIDGLVQNVEDFPQFTEIFQHRRPLIFYDTHEAPHWIHLEPVSWIRSCLVLPIQRRDEVIGVLRLDAEVPHAFSTQDAERLEPLTHAAAIAIEKARLLENLEEEVEARTAEILAERDKSAAILQSVGDAIAVTDTEMQIKYVNKAFIKLTGYLAQEILGQSLTTLLPEHPARRSELPQRTEQTKFWEGNLVIQRKDGRTYDANMTVSPMHDADQKLSGYVTSHQDVSRAQALARAQHQFIINISHQLRTPLSTLRVYVDLLLNNTNTSSKGRQHLQALDMQVTQLVELVQDILEIARLDSDQAIRYPERFDLKNVIIDVFYTYRKQTGPATATLYRPEIPPQLPPVQGDPQALTTLFSEIVENALNFTPAGGQVRLRADLQEKDGKTWIKVQVTDTGPGLTPEEEEHIFDRFFRGQLAESGHIPGTGLGLSIAQEIAHAHGGKVTVASRLDEGSTFTVWLPPAPPLKHA